MFYARLVVVIVLVMALAEAIPEAVNAILVVVLVGIALRRASSFAKLFDWLGKLS